MASLAEELQSKGFLSVNKLVQYLKEYVPIKAVSYPTLMKMIKHGDIEAIEAGAQLRVPLAAIENYIQVGIRVRGDGGNSSSLLPGLDGNPPIVDHMPMANPKIFTDPNQVIGDDDEKESY